MNKEFMVWLRRNCITNWVELNGEYDYYWCLAIEAAEMWDGIYDDGLKFYNDVQIFELYKNKTELTIS